MRSWAWRAGLLLVASLLVWREVVHLSEPFLHNPIDTFVDVFVGVSAVLMIANALGFRGVVWWRSVGPCLAALFLLQVGPFRFSSPGYRLAEWAELSPWYGHQPPVHLYDIDPWMALGADLLIFTFAFSVVLLVAVAVGRIRPHHVEVA
jgi:hypothetical protein